MVSCIEVANKVAGSRSPQPRSWTRHAAASLTDGQSTESVTESVTVRPSAPPDPPTDRSVRLPAVLGRAEAIDPRGADLDWHPCTSRPATVDDVTGVYRSAAQHAVPRSHRRRRRRMVPVGCHLIMGRGN